MGNQKQVSLTSMLMKLGVIISALIGVYVTGSAGGFMQSGRYLFFTIQSNLWIAAICLVFLVYDVISIVKKERCEIPNLLYYVKFIFTVAITLTFVVFSLLLTPPMIMGGNAAYLVSLSNIYCHNLTPILAILDFILFDYRMKTTNKTFLWGMTMPWYYVAFALIASFSGVDFGDGAKVPYFFFDYEKNGWLAIGNGKFGVIYWIILLGIAVVFMGWAIIKLNRKRAQRIFAKNEE